MRHSGGPRKGPQAILFGMATLPRPPLRLPDPFFARLPSDKNAENEHDGTPELRNFAISVAQGGDLGPFVWEWRDSEAPASRFFSFLASGETVGDKDYGTSGLRARKILVAQGGAIRKWRN